MTKKVQQTLQDMRGIDFLLTRFNSKAEIPDDLDILISPSNFEKCVETLISRNYQVSSHDKALGGRTAGMQVNLTKFGRIKIDLHQNFTWRTRQYVDLGLIWNNLQVIKINNVKVRVPRDDVDAFLILINIIFEKTYLTQIDYEKIKDSIDTIFRTEIFENQAFKHGWIGSFSRLKKWWNKEGKSNDNFPKFLPTSLIIGSYFEKFNIPSLAYYIFFRTRYLVNSQLPYNSVATLISLTGFDGVGKSTQVKFLLDYLRKKKLRVRATEAMFSYFVLKPLISSLRTATGSPTLGPVKRNRNPLLKLWFIPAFIDIWLGYIFKIHPILAKHDFVIADRFYTDIWANLAYYGYLPNWAFGIFLKLLPKADIPFLLSVDPKIVQQREREFPPDYYKEQAKIYKKLPQYVNFYIIDASKRPKIVFAEIKKLCSLGQK